MNYSLIAEGENAGDLSACEDLLSAGDKGQVLAYVNAAPSTEQLVEIQRNIQENGASLTAPLQYDPSIGAVVISFQKQPAGQTDRLGFSASPMSTMQIIGGGLSILLGIGIVVFAWQVLKSVSTGAGVLWLIIGGVALYFFIKSQEGKEVLKTGKQASSYLGKAAIRRWEAGAFDKPKYAGYQKPAKGREEQVETYRAPRPGEESHYNQNFEDEEKP